MTDTKTYNVRDAEVIITATVKVHCVTVSITVDLSKLDENEPPHGEHQLVQYFNLPNYEMKDAFWWCKVGRTVHVKTGSQASRVIKNALSKIDDAICKAVQDRQRRKSEMQLIFE